MITIYRSDITGNAGNCLYSHKVNVKNVEDLKDAVSKDYVCAAYKNNYRNNDNFISSNCLPVDCDNDHSDDPNDWVTVDDVKHAFPGVSFAVHYSRNHMKEKKGKAARPKFHIIFPIDEVTNKDEYANLKKEVCSYFHYFDTNALDAARFFFGTDNPIVEIVKGNTNLSAFLKEEDEEFDRDFGKIKEGGRNSTMSKYAAKFLKRYGDTDEAYDAFIELSKKCDPPLDDEELSQIWRSAKKFFNNKVTKDPSYVAPDKYNDPNSYMPADFTDVGQATVLAKFFSNELRYSPGTDFIRYKENYWQESKSGAQAVVHELTRRQLLEADRLIIHYRKELEKCGAQQLMNTASSNKKAIDAMNDAQLEVFKKYKDACKYRDFVLSRRESNYISATLKEVKPMVEIHTSDLDSDPFLICTPKGTYDIRKGVDGLREHDPLDFITKITAKSPSDKGKDIWLNCLKKIFSDQELIDYVQMVCGLAAIGKVFVEHMVIAYGDGGNGKSTFWNAIFRTFGKYSGKISADTLTTTCKRNTKPEMAEAKGKRLLIASESQQGARLDESMVKQLCSTDEVQAEKKYKDPFHFVPCHTLVLYTNYLPRISGSDSGIWDRVIVLPFNNRLRGGSDDIKNYADFLYDNAGEYIMTWIIEGAKKAYELDYKIPRPKVVQDAIDTYREQNNWFNHFIEDCCEIDKDYKESSNALYIAYRRYSTDMNEYVRSTTDFYTQLEKAGFTRFVEKRIKKVKGLRLLDDATSEFLS